MISRTDAAAIVETHLNTAFSTGGIRFVVTRVDERITRGSSTTTPRLTSTHRAFWIFWLATGHWWSRKRLVPSQ